MSITDTHPNTSAQVNPPHQTSTHALGAVQLLPEPVAAVATLDPAVDGRPVVVFDFGAGTLDLALVVRCDGAAEVRATDGLPLGGLDLDDELLGVVGDLAVRRLGDQRWRRLLHPQTLSERRERHQLRTSAREAKEALSRSGWTPVHVPGLETELHVTRDQFEQRITPRLQAAVDLTDRLIRSCGLQPQDLGSLLLVGGSAQLPLVATLLLRRLKIAAVVAEHAQLVVADGALRYAPTVTASAVPPSPHRTLLVLSGPEQQPAPSTQAHASRSTPPPGFPSPREPASALTETPPATIPHARKGFGSPRPAPSAAEQPQVDEAPLSDVPTIPVAVDSQLGRTEQNSVTATASDRQTRPARRWPQRIGHTLGRATGYTLLIAFHAISLPFRWMTFGQRFGAFAFMATGLFVGSYGSGRGSQTIMIIGGAVATLGPIALVL